MWTAHQKQAFIILAVGWITGFALMAFGGRVIWFATIPGTTIADLTGAGFVALALLLGGIAVGLAASSLAIVVSSDSAA